MAIRMLQVDENTVIVNDAIKITDSEKGLALKFLTTPTSKWVGPEGRIPSEAGVIFPKPSIHSVATINRPVEAVQAVTKSTTDPYDGVFDDSDSYEYDPHKYVNGNNYYYIKESVKRATEKVYGERWGSFLRARSGGKNDLAKVVRQFIVNGEGRDQVYRYAGKAKNLSANSSLSNYSLVELMQWVALLDGVLSEPVLV